MRLVKTYGCEGWTLVNSDMMRVFERKILRKIFCPIQDGDEIWRIRMNHEWNQLTQGIDIVRLVNAERLVWMGHLTRMDQQMG